MTKIMRELVKIPFIWRFGPLGSSTPRDMCTLDANPHLAMITTQDVKRFLLRGFKLPYGTELCDGKFQRGEDLRAPKGDHTHCRRRTVTVHRNGIPGQFHW